jgi:hypothetical protein
LYGWSHNHRQICYLWQYCILDAEH